jgi:glyceraldehyde 3-phosphate dehydrogenase
MTKIAINGFGRIGRLTLRHILDKNYKNLEVVAVNDLTTAKTLAHLLKYDSNYGIYNKEISFGNDFLIIGNKKIKVFSEKDPEKLPWKDLKIDVVLECSGVFTDYQGSEKHLKAGAKRVVISAPSEGENIPSFILGVNDKKIDFKKDLIVDMGSCTTNCLAPMAKVLNDFFTIENGFMTTIHSYTNDQRILDLPHNDLRRARAAALNMIPTTTGAAKTIGKIIPELKGKMDGIAIRIPTSVVSIVDLICVVSRKTSTEEVNSVFEKASQNKELKGILAFEKEELVSSDFKANEFSAIFDSKLTRVNGNLVKICAWYDNEWAYACRLAEFADLMGKNL